MPIPIYDLTLRASDGRERHTLCYLPTAQCRRDILSKAQERGLSATLTPIPPQRMTYPDYIDPDMRQLLDALSAVLVPKSQRKPTYRTNWHVPYYSRGRYQRI